ncbi:alpha/beta fold hydrolase [Candidatus Riflebacteria bacterium]
MVNPYFQTEEFKAEYPFKSNFININGRHFHYLDEGSGESIVMLHGNPTWSFYYRNLIKGLREQYRTIAPDHIGCGLSDKPQYYSYTLQQHINNLEILLVKELDLKKITLVMHDWGGLIGFGFAKKYPHLVKRLVILNTAAFLIPDVSGFAPSIKAARIPILGAALVRGLNVFARSAVNWCSHLPGVMTDAIKRAYLAPYDSYENRIATLRFVQDIPFSPADASYKVVKAIQESLSLFKNSPMQIIWGMKDFCFDTSFLDTWKGYFPAASILELPDAGHYVIEDGKTQVIERIKSFLKENPLPEDEEPQKDDSWKSSHNKPGK